MFVVREWRGYGTRVIEHYVYTEVAFHALVNAALHDPSVRRFEGVKCYENQCITDSVSPSV